jgi:hypothetical protein
LPTNLVQNELEHLTNNLAILRGMGSSLQTSVKNLDAAVAEISSDDETNRSVNIKGVIRFVQLDDDYCAIDGVIDGLEPGEHAINVFEFGDLSNGFARY